MAHTRWVNGHLQYTWPALAIPFKGFGLKPAGAPVRVQHAQHAHVFQHGSGFPAWQWFSTATVSISGSSFRLLGGSYSLCLPVHSVVEKQGVAQLSDMCAVVCIVCRP